MLETLNLADVKYIDEQDDSDDEEEVGQPEPRQPIEDTRRGRATAVRIEAAAGSSVPNAVACRDAVLGATSVASAKPLYKTKPTIRAGHPQPILLKSPPRNGVRSTPPRTLQLQPCVDRSTKCTALGGSLASPLVNTQLPVASSSSTRDLLKTSQTQDQNRTQEAVVAGPHAKSKVGSDTKESAESCCAGHRFIPRHSDEVLLEMGDPINMEEEYDDLWCKGLNVRTGEKGIFPSVCLADSPTDELEQVSVGVLEGRTVDKLESRRMFVVRFLGSVEAKRSTGVEVLVDAIRKVTCHLVKTLLNRTENTCGSGPAPLCCLTISPLGVQLSGFPCTPNGTDLHQEPPLEKGRYDSMKSHIIHSVEACHEGAITNHFFPLKNITYSGRHPENSRYLGFITKHPTQQRHACHCLAIQEADRDAALLIREILLRRLSAPAVTPTAATAPRALP